MRMRKCWVFIVAMAILGGMVSATEFRSPLIGQTGPLRYVFEEWEDEDYGLKLWAACYHRGAHKAFISHGTDTCPLSTLFFGKSDFYLNEILPGSYAEIGTEYYSPFIAVTQLSPRITYEESGISVGGRWAYPVYKNKGRVGVRVRVPFIKNIEIEREDSGDKNDDPLAEFLTGEVVTRYGLIVNPSPFVSDEEIVAKDVFARAVRADFLQTIPYTADGDPILAFDSNGKPIIVTKDANWDATGIGDEEAYNRVAAVIQSDVGTRPGSPDRLVGISQNPRAPDVDPTALPADGGVNDGKQYHFSEGTNYTPLNVHSGTDAEKLAAKQRASELWITSVHGEGDGGEAFSTASNALWTTLDLALKNYQENVYAWLYDRGGFEFESGSRSGIGDIDVDLFYEHQLNDDVVLEGFVGVRIPMGNNEYCYNPYRPHLGNGKHWEIWLGALVAFQPATWMNIKLDGRYSFVQNSEEERTAAFTGACVKNVGPCVCADVDWEYFVGHVDLNFFHPKTDAISAILGYEFYYKTRDRICFKCSTAESWLGKKYNETTEEWEAYPQTLDNCVASMYTQAISHKIRFEASCRITRWFELFCGGAYAIAGKNAPREADCHGGFVVTF